MYKEDYEYNNKPEDKCEEKCEEKCEVKVKEGTTKCYDKEYEVCGKKETIVNKHYHNNHFTRFNDIMVTDCHFVKNYVEDCNRVHHKVETIDLGTKYLGCSTIEEKKCEWKEPKCHEPKCEEDKKECKKECKNECKNEFKKYIDVSEWEKKDEDCGHNYWCDCKEEKDEKDYDCWY